jgi:hypothetical protein
MINRKGKIMRSSFTKFYCPAMATVLAGLLHDKKPTTIQGTKFPYSVDSRRPEQVGRPEITAAKTGHIRVTPLPCSAFGVALIGPLLTLALAFVSGPAVHALDYTLAEALNATNLVWTADSTDDTSWFVQTAITHDGAAAVESVPRVGAYAAKLHTTVTGPGSLTFWYRFGSGPPLGTELEIVQQKQGTVAQHVLYGGGTYWDQGGMTIGEGIYNLQWGCVVKSTPEAVFLDQIQFTPSVRATIEGLAIANGQAQLKFVAPANLVSSFKLLSAARFSGPWTTNTSAVLSTNAAGASFTFTAPLGGSSAQFYRVLSSTGQ